MVLSGLCSCWVGLVIMDCRSRFPRGPSRKRNDGNQPKGKDTPTPTIYQRQQQQITNHPRRAREYQRQWPSSEPTVPVSSLTRPPTGVMNNKITQILDAKNQNARFYRKKTANSLWFDDCFPSTFMRRNPEWSRNVRSVPATGSERTG